MSRCSTPNRRDVLCAKRDLTLRAQARRAVLEGNGRQEGSVGKLVGAQGHQVGRPYRAQSGAQEPAEQIAVACRDKKAWAKDCRACRDKGLQIVGRFGHRMPEHTESRAVSDQGVASLRHTRDPLLNGLPKLGLPFQSVDTAAQRVALREIGRCRRSHPGCPACEGGHLAMHEDQWLLHVEAQLRVQRQRTKVGW